MRTFVLLEEKRIMDNILIQIFCINKIRNLIIN